MLIEFGIPLKLVSFNKVCVGRYLSDTSPIQSGLKQGGALSPLLLNFALECTIR
jgi:hypothetical protein